MTIDVFADIACPWCYIGEANLAAALRQRPGLAVERRWRPYQLQPDLPRTGAPPEFFERKFGGAEQRQAAFETREAQAGEVLAQRLAALDDALAQRREAQLAEIEKLALQGEAMTERAAELARVVGDAGIATETTRASLGAALDALGLQLDEKRAALAATEAQMAQLTDHGVRLLEILQSGARSCREDLTGAIGGANAAIEGVEARADKVAALMLRSKQAGSDLSDYLLETRKGIDSAEIAIAGFKSLLAGSYDDLPEQAFYMVGGIEEVQEKAAAMAKEVE